MNSVVTMYENLYGDECDRKTVECPQCRGAQVVRFCCCNNELTDDEVMRGYCRRCGEGLAGDCKEKCDMCEGEGEIPKP